MPTLTDASITPQGSAEPSLEREPGAVRCLNTLPFISIHAIGLGVIWVGWSPAAVIVCGGLFLLRMFIITAFYHRYFSHRAFKTHRVTQLLAATIGTTCAQRGPVWWAAHHRDHHRHSDHEPDIHSPRIHGLVWSHMIWFLTEAGFKTNWRAVPDWARYRELVWVERLHLLGPIGLALSMAALGWALQAWVPSLETGPVQMLVWGFAISTVLLYHTTFTINSLAHMIGSRRFETNDDSRNNLVLAILTFGEGWHNNHHYFPGSARQGFYWWEVDLTYYVLRALSWTGLVWDLNPVPHRVYEAARREPDAGGEP